MRKLLRAECFVLVCVFLCASGLAAIAKPDDAPVDQAGSADASPAPAGASPDIICGTAVSDASVAPPTTCPPPPPPPLPHLTASPNPAWSPAGAGATVTLTWAAAGHPTTSIHLGSPTGTLFATGGSQGSAVTGPWVTNGMKFYLDDAGGASLASVTVTVNNYSLTASPNPIWVPQGATAGATTLSWNAPNIPIVDVHLGGVSGALFASGPGTGWATTGNWVTGGMPFTAVDHATGNVLATTTVGLRQISMTISPNPITVAWPVVYGTATLTWNAPGHAVDIHLGDPTGPLFASGPESGSATTAPWVTDGMPFVLVDHSSGQTLATAIAHLQIQYPAGTITASPNPILVTDGTGLGATTVSWSAPGRTNDDIRISTAAQPNVYLAGGIGAISGSFTTGKTIGEGTTFILTDLTSATELARYTVHIQLPILGGKDYIRLGDRVVAIENN